MWAMISGILVFQDTWATTVHTASLRILGSFVGALVSAVYLTLLPFSPVGMAAMIGLTVLICICLRIPDHGRLAAITVGIIMVFFNAESRGVRCCECRPAVLRGDQWEAPLQSRSFRVWPHLIKCHDH